MVIGDEAELPGEAMLRNSFAPDTTEIWGAEKSQSGALRAAQ
jgi:hypothetical protein